MTPPLLQTIMARRLAAVRVLSLGLLLGVWAAPNDAAQSSSVFTVTVTLQKEAVASTGLCSSKAGAGTFGASVTVVCATGLVTEQDAIDKGFLTYISSYEQSGVVDSYTGVGTSTAFRILSAAGQEYVEMMVGW